MKLDCFLWIGVLIIAIVLPNEEDILEFPIEVYTLLNYDETFRFKRLSVKTPSTGCSIV